MESYEKESEEEKEPEPLPSGTDTDRDGHVIIQDGLSVSLSEENEVYMFISHESRDEIRTGMYVQIPYPYNSDPEDENEIEKGTNDELFGIVEKVSYKTSGDINEYTEKLDNSPPIGDSNESRYPMVAKIEPISIIEKNETGDNNIVPVGTKSLDSIPKPNTNVYRSDREEYMRTGLGIPEDGITIGFLSANGMRLPPDSPLGYNIMNPGYESEEESAIWRHTLICGSTGVGKSHTAKNIIRQLTSGTKYGIEDSEGETIHKRPSIIIIDPENEYAQMGQDPEDADEDILEEIREAGAMVGGINDSNLTEFDLKSFVPQVDGFDEPSLSGVHQDFHIPFKMTRNRPKTAINYGANAPTLNAATKILTKFFNNNPNGTYDDFKTWTNYQLSEQDREEMGINEMSWEAALERFDSSVFERVFDSDGPPITSITSDIFRPGRVSVIPTGHLGVSSQNLVIMSILSMIVENKIGSGNNSDIKETPLVLCLDEAHNYLSESDTVRSRYIVDKFRDAAKQGRKYKLGLMMITQNPEDIDNEIRKQTNTRIYLGLREESLDRLNLKPKVRKKVSNFSKGQMMVQSPGVNSVEVEGFEECVTKHD